MFFVYKFIDKHDNVIYVGKSKQHLDTRFRGHIHLPKECYESVHRIEYIECLSETDMSIKEIYYINKYRHDGMVQYNQLDVADLPQDVSFNDEWIQYMGGLTCEFKNSINYLAGYKSVEIVKYRKDGGIKLTPQNNKRGRSKFVEPLTKDEVDRFIQYYTKRIQVVETTYREYKYFRNFLIFLIGISTPLKISEVLGLKYKDLFDENENLRSLKFVKQSILGKTYSCNIELPDSLGKLLKQYKNRYGMTYMTNSEKYFFTGKFEERLDSEGFRVAFIEDAKIINIEKKVGAESLRKTYALHIFNSAENKFVALDYLEIILGQKGIGDVARYIGIVPNDDQEEFSAFFNMESLFERNEMLDDFCNINL